MNKDKQIIIDGIDVSKCTCFDNGECLNPCETVTSCEASINCRYKQLKRKEQECEAYKMEAEEGKEINAELKAENERLQKLIAQDQCFQNKSHKCVKSFYIDERYKQAIEKIKDYCNKYPQNSIGFKQQILQICDEVTNDLGNN